MFRTILVFSVVTLISYTNYFKKPFTPYGGAPISIEVEYTHEEEVCE